MKPSYRAALLRLLAATLLAGCTDPSVTKQVGHAQAPAGSGAASPALRVDPEAVTVSGISAGGYMATQLHVAHSQRIAGAGIVAAGPYYCAEGGLDKALARCMKTDSAPQVDASLGYARAAAGRGEIDPVEALRGARVWIFHGTRDAVMSAPLTTSLADFYRALAGSDNVTVVTDVEAAHLWPTPGQGTACTQTTPPFIGACGYDAAGELLAHLNGELRPPGSGGGELREFDQTPFVAQSGSRGLAESGYLFVPSACASGTRCRLHIALHGCAMGSDTIGDAFASDAGFNRWAATNDILVLYPQVKKTAVPLNPQGCWDWWGYEDAEYATRGGTQVRAIMAMVDSLVGFEDDAGASVDQERRDQESD